MFIQSQAEGELFSKREVEDVHREPVCVISFFSPLLSRNSPPCIASADVNAPESSTFFNFRGWCTWAT